MISDNNKNVSTVIEQIENCKKDRMKNGNTICYLENYSKLWEEYNDLINSKPLIDNYRNQKILLISQAPNRQAMLNGVLNDLKNSFLHDKLLPKIFPNLPLENAFDIWYRNVFWCHTANCYPGPSKGGDKIPNMKCAKLYIDRIIDFISPNYIVLMSWASTKHFAKIIKNELGIRNNKTYPSLLNILKKQMELPDKLVINNIKYIVIPHLSTWNGKGKAEIHSIELVRSILNGNFK